MKNTARTGILALATTAAIALVTLSPANARAEPPTAAAKPIDTVHLKGGGRVNGTVMVESPKDGVTVMLADGTSKVFAYGEVDRIDYAKASDPATAPDAHAAEGHSNAAGWTLFGVGTGLLVVSAITTGAITAGICDGTCGEGTVAAGFVPLAGPPVVAATARKPSGGQIAALVASTSIQAGCIALAVAGLLMVEGGAGGSASILPKGVFVAPRTDGPGAMVGGTF